MECGGDEDDDTLPATPEPEVAPRRGVYVASRVKHAPMWRAMRAAGRPIRATWIWEGDAPNMTELWARVVRDVQRAERLVLYVVPLDFPLKGAFVEVGIALGAGIPVFVVSGDAPECLLGSWINHPLVTRCASLDEAFALREAA